MKATVQRALFSLGVWVLVVAAMLGAMTSGAIPWMRGAFPGVLVWGVLCGLVALVPWKRPWLGSLVAVLLMLPVAVLTFMLNFKTVRVEGASMQPTFHEGDVLLVDTLATPSDTSVAGHEIYVLEVEGEEHNPLVKRLVGRPGQRTAWRDGRVFADGHEVWPLGIKQSDLVLDRWRFAMGQDLGRDEYFFMGDNPRHSRDSRHFGPVPASSSRGRVVWRLKGPSGSGPVD